MVREPWAGPREELNGNAIISVLIIDDDRCFASAEECLLYVNSGYLYSVDYNADPSVYVYRQDSGDTPLQRTVYQADGAAIDLVWDAYDVAPRLVTLSVDRSDPERWTTYLRGGFGFDGLTFYIDRELGNLMWAERDTDGDGFSDLVDQDIDGDGVKDYLDPDADGDGLSNIDEIRDGLGNWLITDSDGDGTLDPDDQMPFDPNETRDADGDGIGDNADEDDDNDGTPDTVELEQGTDPFDAASYPGSGGLISAHAEFVGAFDRGDGEGAG